MTVLALCLGPAVVAFSIVLFGVVLPSFDKTWSPGISWERIGEKAVQRQETIDVFWSDKKPGISLALDGLMGLVLAAFGLWCLYKVFMYFCRDLDKEGRWNNLIASRRTQHDYRSK